MNEFIKEINQINHMISTNIASLTSEKHKTDFLLNHMKQGICVLDNQKRIILLNKTLKDIYRFNIDININKDFRFLFREEDIQQAIDKVYLKQENAQLIIEKDARYYSISITYSKESWQDHQSVIIIYTDITSIRQIEILKRDFFVNASHELKSPLTSIMGSSELIIQGMVNDKAGMVDLIERIHHEAKRMNHLVMDMLLLSELENQNQIKDKHNIQVEAILNDVINNLSFLIKEQNTSIIQNIHVKTLRFNAEDFYQMLKNIIENSIKYGQVNGHVWINIDQDDHHHIIDIKDDGIGIPKDDQERIFERFYRVDKARSRNSGGTGLGLSIVKHIILNYHGHIALESQANKGTTITIKIPK
jgi:two-component system phosphate regulon sensor histidine kinase PhoR